MFDQITLKVCEACGKLWYRPASESSPYCASCVDALKDFPTPESRKRRGRPATKRGAFAGSTLATVYANAEESGESYEVEA